MKLKAEKIVEIWKTLNKFGEQNMTLATAIKIADNIDILRKPVEIFEKKEKELINQYAVKDENGNIKAMENGGFQIENAEHFLKEHNELINTEVDIRFTFIAESELAELKLSPNDYIALKPILEKKKADEKPQSKRK